MSGADILLLALIAVAALCALRSIRRHKSCSGDCSRCSSECKRS